MAILLTTHRFTVADYHRMVEARILDEDDRVELIEGEIVDMSPIGRKHAVCVARLTDVFGERLRRRAVVWPQNPIRLDEHTEPQRDLALLRWRSDYYAERDPTPADVLLLIEVCDTSLAVDRDLKALLYARAGIPEVWVLDLNGRDVIVFRDPAPAGYRSIDTYRGGDRLPPGSFLDLSFTADQILSQSNRRSWILLSCTSKSALGASSRPVDGVAAEEHNRRRRPSSPSAWNSRRLRF